MPRDFTANLPATIRVTFPGRACEKATTAPATWSKDVAIADAGPGGAGTGSDAVLGLVDTCAAAYKDATPTTNPSNASTLTDLASLAAHDVWQWRTAAFDRAYAGIVAPGLSGLDDSICWSYREGDASTRLASAPPDDVVAHFNHADPAACVPGVGVYASKPAASVSGTTNKSLRLTKIKLRVERGRLVAVDDGADVVALCGGAAAGGESLVTQGGGTQATQDGQPLVA